MPTRINKDRLIDLITLLSCIWLISTGVRLITGEMIETILNFSLTGLSVGWLASQAHNEKQK